MIPTPILTHLTRDDYEHVYEPAEDTFLLLDALEQDADHLRSLSPSICLEIGSGSGCVSSFAGSILGSSVLYLCTDINTRASQCTFKTGAQNGVSLEPIVTSLATSLETRLYRAVDLILFNPPYVPTVAEEANDAQDQHGITGSWAGGTDGMEITNQFLGIVGDLLSATGQFYLVAVKENDIQGIRDKMLREQALSSQIVMQRRAGRELLYVLRFSR